MKYNKKKVEKLLNDVVSELKLLPGESVEFAVVSNLSLWRVSFENSNSSVIQLAESEGRETEKESSPPKKAGRPKKNVGECLIPDCRSSARTKNLCSRHYQRHIRRVRSGKPGLISPRGAVIQIV